MPLVVIPATLFREVEWNAIGLNWGWTTQLSGVNGRFDWWRHPCQLMKSRFSSGVEEVVGGGGVYHVFVSWLHVLQVPLKYRLLVESVMFPTDPRPGAWRRCNLGNLGLGGAVSRLPGA